MAHTTITTNKTKHQNDNDYYNDDASDWSNFWEIAQPQQGQSTNPSANPTPGEIKKHMRGAQTCTWWKYKILKFMYPDGEIDLTVPWGSKASNCSLFIWGVASGKGIWHRWIFVARIKVWSVPILIAVEDTWLHFEAVGVDSHTPDGCSKQTPVALQRHAHARPHSYGFGLHSPAFDSLPAPALPAPPGATPPRPGTLGGSGGPPAWLGAGGGKFGFSCRRVWFNFLNSSSNSGWWLARTTWTSWIPTMSLNISSMRMTMCPKVVLSHWCKGVSPLVWHHSRSPWFS